MKIINALALTFLLPLPVLAQQQPNKPEVQSASTIAAVSPTKEIAVNGQVMQIGQLVSLLSANTSSGQRLRNPVTRSYAESRSVQPTVSEQESLCSVGSESAQISACAQKR